MNKVFLIGRLTKDATTQPKKDGKGNYTKFSLAVNRFPENVDYFDCVAFDKTGEAIIAYTKKGAKIAISGRIQMDKYTTKESERLLRLPMFYQLKESEVDYIAGKVKEFYGI